MTDLPESGFQRITRWPFFVGDLLLVGVALVCYAHGRHWPFGDVVGLEPWLGWVMTTCFFLGAVMSVLPFFLEHRLQLRVAEVEKINAALQRVRNIEQVSRQIGSATAGWQAIQDDAGKAVESASGLAERMAGEAKAFQEFLTKANDSERAHLRLEVEKLRRAEADWLQVLVTILDHVWALHRAAVLSNRAHLVEQIDHFQRVCRDAARRVGLAPFEVAAGEGFDPELHQAAEADSVVEPGVAVADTVATGYRFQGQLVRKAMVVFTAPTFPGEALAASEDGQLQAGESIEPDRGSSGAASGQTDFSGQLDAGFSETADPESAGALTSEESLGAEEEEGGVDPFWGDQERERSDLQ